MNYIIPLNRPAFDYLGGGTLALPDITLLDMAEAVEGIARDHRHHVEMWDRDHPGEPLPDGHPRVRRALTFERAHFVLAIMATDEDASRKFFASLMRTDDGKQLAMMLAPQPRKAFKPMGEAA